MGEIWRDMCLIEFLMRCALARKEGDINELPWAHAQGINDSCAVFQSNCVAV